MHRLKGQSQRLKVRKKEKEEEEESVGNFFLSDVAQAKKDTAGQNFALREGGSMEKTGKMSHKDKMSQYE
jgi:hypothetical protein